MIKYKHYSLFGGNRMEKPIVFISHITEEKEMALELKQLIEESFLGMLSVFVSSDENSISSGSRWLDNITSALGNCAIELILCSPKSVKRPWINFEAGAGWIREIPVIPLCHSGMEPSSLPVPLNLLQAAKISEMSNLKLIFPVLASAIGAKCPNVMFDDFIDKMKELERKYSFWNENNSSLNKFYCKYPQIFEFIKNGNTSVKLRDTEIKELEEILKPFIDRNYVSLLRTGNLEITGKGMRCSVDITSSQKYKDLFLDKACKFCNN